MKNLPLTFVICKVRGRFRKIYWPSQNISTLHICYYCFWWPFQSCSCNVFRFICRMTFEKLSKMSRSSIWNRIFIVFIVSGFVIFKFVIYVPTSTFQNIITNVVTNISQSNSMEEIESTSENFMQVSLWFSIFEFWIYLHNNWVFLTFLEILVLVIWTECRMSNIC